MKKKLFTAAAAAILALSTATCALAVSSTSSSRGAYPHYHGFRYCRQDDCAPASSARPQASSTVRPQITVPPQTESFPQTTPLPDAAVKPDSSLGRRMLDMVNSDRTDNGLSPLTWSNELAEAAAKHSQDMAENSFFSHTSPSMGTFPSRLKAAGIAVQGAGENLALYNSLEKAQAALMSSSGHRANILKTGYTHCGIGVVYSKSKGAYYITQWFAKMK